MLPLAGFDQRDSAVKVRVAFNPADACNSEGAQ